MTLDERCCALLTYLLHSDSYVSMSVLIEKLKISRRTLYYDLDKINSWLKYNHLDPVKYIRSAGFYLDDKTKEAIPAKIKNINKWHYEYSAKERKAWLVIHILSSTEKIFLSDLVESIRVSRNTAISDLKILKQEITKFNLKIFSKKHDGYVVEGNEHDKRKALIFYLSHVISTQSQKDITSHIQMILNKEDTDGVVELFADDKMEAIHQLIADCERNLGIQFTSEVFYSLSLHLLLFVKRFLQGRQVTMDPVEKKVLESTKAYTAAKEISTKLQQLFKITFSEDEVFYFATHILSAKVNYYESHDNQHEFEANLRKIIHQMVNDFERYACFKFQERKKLEEDLMTHLKPAYYRVKYGLDLDNPLIDLIKEKYTEIFMLTKKVMHHLERSVGKKVNDNEVAFITMHFGGWMKREGVELAPRKKVLLVCASGVGTSRMLEYQLQGLFPTVDLVGTVSLREYENNEYDVDFVISTALVSKKNKNVFVVNPILTDAEKESLLKKVNSLIDANDTSQYTSIDGLIKIISKHATIHNQENLSQELKQYIYKPLVNVKEALKPMLCDLITKDKIQLIQSVENWQDAIRLTAQPLLEAEFINDNYITAMIDNVKEYGPYIIITPKVAIPHARPEQGVKKIGMSFLRIKEGVDFSDQEEHKAFLIIILAAVDNETHLKALTQLTTLLSEENNIEQLVEANSVDEVLHLINKYSN